MTIPWLVEERKNLGRRFQMEAVGVMIHPKRLLALITIAEAAAVWDAAGEDECPALTNAVGAARKL